MNDPRRCVCGHLAEPHDCPGDPNQPGAASLILECDLRIRTCSECGTEDPSVASKGALCRYCADLSALQAPAKERQWRRRVLRARLTGLALIAAVSIWLIVALVLCGRQDA